MKYIVKLSMWGSFPGSPDHDYYEVDEKTWMEIIKMLKERNFKRHDTQEEIGTGYKLGS